MTSHNPESPVPLATTLPGAAQRLPLLERMSRYRQPIGLVVTLVLFTMALVACRHLLSELDIYALHDAMLSVPTQSLLGALLATVLGFVILLGYEWSASRYAGVKLPASSLVLGGFSAFAIGNAIGLSMLRPSRLKAQGYDARAAVENISAGYHTLAEAFSGWRDSPPHRANMLNANVTKMGIAATYAPNTKYKVFWALVLAKPAG